MLEQFTWELLASNSTRNSTSISLQTPGVVTSIILVLCSRMISMLYLFFCLLGLFSVRQLQPIKSRGITPYFAILSQFCFSFFVILVTIAITVSIFYVPNAYSTADSVFLILAIFGGFIIVPIIIVTPLMMTVQSFKYLVSRNVNVFKVQYYKRIVKQKRRFYKRGKPLLFSSSNGEDGFSPESLMTEIPINFQGNTNGEIELEYLPSAESSYDLKSEVNAIAAKEKVEIEQVKTKFKLFKFISSNWLNALCYLLVFFLILALVIVCSSISLIGFYALHDDLVGYLFIVGFVGIAFVVFNAEFVVQIGLIIWDMIANARILCCCFPLNPIAAKMNTKHMPQITQDLVHQVQRTNRFKEYFVNEDPFLFRSEMVCYLITILLIAPLYYIPLITLALSLDQELYSLGIIFVVSLPFEALLSLSMFGYILFISCVWKARFKASQSSILKFSKKAEQDVETELLDTIFCNPTLLILFTRYAQQEFSVENVAAYLELKQIVQSTDLEERTNLLEHLYQYYVASGSDFELNITKAIREQIVTMLEDGKKGVDFQNSHLQPLERAICQNLMDTIARFEIYEPYVMFKKNSLLKESMVKNLV